MLTSRRVGVAILLAAVACSKEPAKSGHSAPQEVTPEAPERPASTARGPRGSGPVDAATPNDKSTHGSSAQIATLAERVAFLERYVKFRRRYESLDFFIDYIDDVSSAPGPSSVGCDIRLYARVPADELQQWTAGLTKGAAPSAADASWADVPNAPKSVGFVWYHAAASPFGGDKIVGVRRGNPASAPAEILYRLICARN